MVKRKERVWALLLSAALIVVQLPVTAMAENRGPEDGSIASFEALDGSVRNQTVPTGTELTELNLPDTVTADIYHIIDGEDELILDEDEESIASPSEADKRSESSTRFAEEIFVTWDSDPVYDSYVEGSYRFTADVGSYILSDGVNPPTITVTVKQGITEESIEQPAEKPIEKPTENKVPCTLTEGCTLSDGHEGGCIPPADNSLIKTITGWTFVDDGALDEGELAIPGVHKENQADFDQVVKLLPTQIRAVVEGREATELLDITRWSCPEYIREEGNWPFSGDYIFTAELPEGYVCAQQPSVRVLLGGANTYAANNTLTKGGLTIAASNNGEVEYDDATGFTLKKDGDYEISGEWTGTLTASGPANIITVPSGVTANVILNEVTIDVSEKEQHCAFSVKKNGEVHLFLKNENVLKSGKGRSGISVLGNFPGQSEVLAKLTIDGENTAELIVSGGDGGAGIGSEDKHLGGQIIINSGTVRARGYGEGSGIGSNGFVHGGHIYINGGIVTATSDSGAGIGGGDNCYLEISGGEVTATSTDGAGIGGGSYEQPNGRIDGGSGGRVIITGGFVRATSDNGAGIGGGKCSNGGKLGMEGYTKISGDAVVFVSHIGRGDGDSGDPSKTQLINGVVFVKDTGMVYGSPAIPADLTIPENYTLTVPENSSLTIPDGITLVNQGTLENQGTINNQGTIDNYGTIMGSQPIGGGTVKDVSTTEVTFAVKKNGSYGNQTATAVAGDTVKITATAQKKPANGLQRNAAQGKVDFYIETIHPDHKLGTATVETDGGFSTAAIEITLSGQTWNKGFSIGDNTIIADFGGMDHLFGSTGSAVLTISRSGDNGSSGSNSSSGSSGSSGGSGGSYSNTSILQGTWVQTDTGVWKFRRTNGSYPKNQWGIADGLWYYFDSEGHMLTGWQFINGQWYYLCTDETAKVRNGMKEGAMASGWYYDLFYQNWFYFDENGAMVTGWREIDGTRYYFNPESDGKRGILVTE